MKSRLGGLYSNLLLGLVLVIVAIWILIGIRPALMVAAGIPVAFLLTFVMIQAYGFSVNTLVLFSLILVIGLVVDDAIVVCENIYRHYETGMPLAQAAIKGTEQIMLPVCATVMTTVAAFLPLLIMEGLLGEFMGIIPVVVTFALLASLAESFFVLPSHVAEWGGKRPPTGLDETRPWFHRTLERYRKMLRTALRLRYLAVALVIVAAFGSLALARFGMDFVLFGGRDLSSFSVAVEAPPGATVEETTRILTEIEEKALELNGRTGEADSIRMEVGGLQRGGMNRSSGTNLGEVTFDLVDINDRDRFGSAIADEVRDLVGDVTGVRALNIEESQEGPPVGKPVQVRIIGDNFDTLREISERIKTYLHGVDGVKDIIDSFPPGKDEVRPALDLEKIAALGLDVRTIATEIRGAFDGLEATRVYDGDEEIEVMVKYDEASRASLSSLADMQFATPQGMVPFANVARLERRPGVASITHYFETRTINVTADVITDVDHLERREPDADGRVLRSRLRVPRLLADLRRRVRRHAGVGRLDVPRLHGEHHPDLRDPRRPLPLVRAAADRHVLGALRLHRRHPRLLPAQRAARPLLDHRHDRARRHRRERLADHDRLHQSQAPRRLRRDRLDPRSLLDPSAADPADLDHHGARSAADRRRASSASTSSSSRWRSRSVGASSSRPGSA